MRFRRLSYVAAILLLGGMLAANLTPRTYASQTTTPTPHRDGDFSQAVGRQKWSQWSKQLTCYGWPKAMLTSEKEHYGPLTAFGVPTVTKYHWLAIILNIAIGLAIPIAGLLACESVLRRWAKKAET